MEKLEKILYALADKNQLTKNNERGSMIWRFDISRNSHIYMQNIVNDIIEIKFLIRSDEYPTNTSLIEKSIITSAETIKNFITDCVEHYTPKSTSFLRLCPVDKQEQYNTLLKDIFKTELNPQCNFLGEKFATNYNNIKWSIERESFGPKYELLIEEEDRVHVIFIKMPESSSLLETIKIEGNFLVRVNNREEILHHTLLLSPLAIKEYPLLTIFQETQFNNTNSLEDTINFLLENAKDKTVTTKLSYLNMEENINSKNSEEVVTKFKI